MTVWKPICSGKCASQYVNKRRQSSMPSTTNTRNVILCYHRNLISKCNWLLSKLGHILKMLHLSKLYFLFSTLYYIAYLMVAGESKLYIYISIYDYIYICIYIYIYIYIYYSHGMLNSAWYKIVVTHCDRNVICFFLLTLITVSSSTGCHYYFISIFCIYIFVSLTNTLFVIRSRRR